MRLIDVRSDPEAAIAAAQEVVRAGDCLVLPTDTVYGIGADALQPAAVAALLAAKRRGRDMPPPVLVSDVAMVRALAAEVPQDATILGEALWPGALTLILPSQANLRMDLGDREGTIAVRVPDHDFTRELLRATGPLAVSSANVNKRPPAATVMDAWDQLGAEVALYLDCGPASEPVPSTIVDLTGERPRILRQGRISREQIASLVGLAEDTED